MNLEDIGTLIRASEQRVDQIPSSPSEELKTLLKNLVLNVKKDSAQLEQLKAIIDLNKPFEGITLPSKEGELSLLIKGQIVQFASQQLSSTTSLAPSTSLLLMLTEQDGKAYLKILDQLPSNEVKISQNDPQQVKEVALQSLQTGSKGEQSIAALFQRILQSAAPDLPLQGLRDLIHNSSQNQRAFEQTSLQQTVVKKLLQSFSLKESDFQNSEQLTKALKELIHPERLFRNTIHQELNSAKGEGASPPKNDLTSLIKEVIKTLEQHVGEEKQTVPTLLKLQNSFPTFLKALQLPNQIGANNNQLLHELTQLIQGALKEVTETPEVLLSSREVIKSLSQLHQAIQKELSVLDNTTESSHSKNHENLSNALSLGESTKLKNTKQQNPLSQLENFIQGQDALRRMAPLMQQIGEPMFILIPGFLSGFLQNLEVSLYPKNQVDNEDKQDASKLTDGYQRIALSFSFPKLGPVRVDIAYRNDHVLMSLASEEERIVEYIDQHLPKLKHSLNLLGFHRSELIARKTLREQKSIRPRWLEESLRTKAIA